MGLGRLDEMLNEPPKLLCATLYLGVFMTPNANARGPWLTAINYPFIAITLISTFTFLGKPFTATVSLAG